MRCFIATVGVWWVWLPFAVGDNKEGKVRAPSDDQTTIVGEIVARDVLDRRRNYPCKIHAMKLSKDKTYIVELLSQAFDPYLRIEDSKGNNLAEDDDSGGNLQSRLAFRPPANDTYQLIATSYAGGTGMYTLIVRVADGPKKSPVKK
ncbi:MAG: hypothetical protein NZO58_05445 [Gemmataceae bacterium]|nr:hypothetical protein [Gemmataceae bacterium]